MTDGVRSRPVTVVRGGTRVTMDDLVIEEPLEISVNGTSVAVVMRTPGHDADLVLGFALTEGIVGSPGDVAEIIETDAQRWDLRTTSGFDVDPALFQRNFYSTSSCGVCGKASIDAIRVAGAKPGPGPTVGIEVLVGLPDALAGHQMLFRRTGGLHAAAAFEPSGEIVVVREDVGRHNAVDKVIGSLAAQGWPPTGVGLLVSGRISFEITQKAAVAGIGFIAGVSAASSLAVELGEEFAMTVVGFVRDGGATIYCDQGRITGT